MAIVARWCPRAELVTEAPSTRRGPREASKRHPRCPYATPVESPNALSDRHNHLRQAALCPAHLRNSEGVRGGRQLSHASSEGNRILLAERKNGHQCRDLKAQRQKRQLGCHVGPGVSQNGFQRPLRKTPILPSRHYACAPTVWHLRREGDRFPRARHPMLTIRSRWCRARLQEKAKLRNCHRG